MSRFTGGGGEYDDDILGFPGNRFKYNGDTHLDEDRSPPVDDGDVQMNEEEVGSDTVVTRNVREVVRFLPITLW